MAVGLLGGDPAFVDEGLHEGVVLGDLRQFAVAQQVAAGVADVDQAQPVAGEQDGGQRGSHTVEVGVDLDLFMDGLVALAYRALQFAQQVAAWLVVVQWRQRGDHQLGGHLAGGMPAHPVGQGQQPRPGVHRVLIVRAHQAAVAAGGVSQGEGHGRSSITVLPMCTGVPTGTRTAFVTRERSR